MAELNEYSLWIVPSSDVKQRFSGMIDDLAGRYEAPKFEPHMTLLGDLKGNEEGLLNKAYEIAGAISPFRIRMTEIDYLDAYFRCLFIRAEETGPLQHALRRERNQQLVNAIQQLTDEQRELFEAMIARGDSARRYRDRRGENER